MEKASICKVAYPDDAARLFSALRSLPWAVWLDSGAATAGGRYQILTAAPQATLVSREGVIERTEGGRVQRRRGDVFDALGRELRARPLAASRLPFVGGAIGYFSYGLGERLAPHRIPRAASHLPEAAVGIYDWAVVLDCRRTEAWLVSAQGEARARRRWLEDRVRAGSAAPRPFRARGALVQEPASEAYAAAFSRVQRYIRDGDCYQVNLARRFRIPCDGDPLEGYGRLREHSPAPYGAYLEYPFASVLSNSPERFLNIRDGRVQARPIKGTRPRGRSAEADAARCRELATSAKDRAENVMIVDLLRNDLGRHAVPGSVRVSELCAVESFATVHHLVSTVEAETRGGATAAEVLRGCFPGGSITGAPKQRAMEIIAELEPAAREIYCGCIGYLGFDGAMDTSIAIRTGVVADGLLTYWAGGGIVSDSQCEDEFDETLHKAEAFARLLA